MNGRNIFMGYLNMKDKTQEVFDKDLRLMSGDIGKKDDDGFLFITGRIKGNSLKLLSNVAFHFALTFQFFVLFHFL